MRRCVQLYSLLLFVGLMQPLSSAEALVTDIQAFYRAGQVFITCVEESDPDVQYRFYRSPVAPDSIDAMTWLGAIGLNSTLNRRRAVEGNGVPTFCIQSEVPLPENVALFVHTTVEPAGSYYYAITTVSDGIENTNLVPGQNLTTLALPETLAAPAPVLQQTVTFADRTYDIYSMWTSNAGTALYPKMCVAPSVPFNFMVMRKPGTGLHPLYVYCHPRNGNYWGGPGQPHIGTGLSSEYMVSCDDPVPAAGLNTFWIGYNETADWATFQPPPTSGINYPYTTERIKCTLRMVLEKYAVDPERIIMGGFSMGGTAAAFVGHELGAELAARRLDRPKLNFSGIVETFPAQFNPGMPQRLAYDRLCGTVASNLMFAGGHTTYDWANYGYRLGVDPSTDMGFITIWAAKRDSVVGWLDKFSTIAALDSLRVPYKFFWDNGTHTVEGEWGALRFASSWVYDHRRSWSLPAFSNCSANDVLGNGAPATAAAFGTWNGHLDWVKPASDSQSAWSVSIFKVNLPYNSGTKLAPDTIRVDVTPCRSVRFIPTAGVSHAWEVRRTDTNELIASGYSTPNARGQVTVPQVPITSAGARVTIFAPATGVSDPRFERIDDVWMERNPAAVEASIRFLVRQSGPVAIGIYDVSGRRLAESVESYPTGVGTYTWTGRDNRGRQAPSGRYFFRLETNSEPVRIVGFTFLR